MDELIGSLEEAAWRALERDADAKNAILVIIKHVANTNTLSTEQRNRLSQLAVEIMAQP